MSKLLCYLLFVSRIGLQIQIPAGLSQEEAELYSQLDPDRLPRHIAIIMDGNGRWAKSRNLPRVAGHKAGVEAVRSVITCAARIHLSAVTMYAFSVENWKRPKDETNFIMGLILSHLKPELPLFEENNVRMEFIGRFNELPPDLQEDMEYVRRATSKNTGLVMTLALNYGARAEIIDAFQKIFAEAEQNGGMRNLKIDEEMVSRHLYTNRLPELDLVIRTSGEMRVSNFLLWQLAYSEIYVTETYWPDFNGAHLLRAIADYQKRDRRFGGLGEAK